MLLDLLLVSLWVLVPLLQSFPVERCLGRRSIVAVAAGIAVVAAAEDGRVGGAAADGDGRVKQAPRCLARGTCHQVWGTA